MPVPPPPVLPELHPITKSSPKADNESERVMDILMCPLFGNEKQDRDEESIRQHTMQT